MRHHLLIIGLSVLALQSCTGNPAYTELSDDKSILPGHARRITFTENLVNRQSSPLPAGSPILLNASGSFQIENQVLTYTGDRWKAETELEWTDYAGTTNVMALHPVHPDFTYTQDNLYTGGSLEDVLYAEGEFTAGGSIDLQFRHLFSLLTLHLDGELQQDFQGIAVTCPTIASIDPKTAQVTLSQEARHTTSATQFSSSGECSFIIPSAEGMNVSINIQANGKTYSTELLSKPFASGKEYTYNIKTSEKTPGIVTAEDWIIFCQLINKSATSPYQGKTLEDFGETVNGVTTYYLLNDIDFAGVDCRELEPIGYTKNNYYFQDIFDGKGHVLSNMPIEPYWGATGVFGTIAASAVVKNLHVKSCHVNITKSTTTSTASGTSILVGNNRGMILNCSVEDCSIITENPKDDKQSAYTGGIAGNSTGQIINCYVKNININYSTNNKYKAKPAGGIVGSSQGLILNCYSANNTIRHTGSFNGGICGYAKGARTENCYVYSITQMATKGLFAGQAESSYFVHNCYRSSEGSLIGKSNTSGQTSGSIKYTDSFTDEANGIPIYQLLNQWIDETAPSLYPDYTFTRWKDGGNEGLPATFEAK